MMMQKQYEKPRSVRIADADRNAVFPSGLEYNTPARGMWNIVHTGMLIPGAHQIFACAQGCLRGVILTADEMGALDRMSWISVSEQDMYDGSLETDIIDGVSEIVGKLDPKPPLVLLYLSCIHLFAGVDFEMIIRTLHEKFPDIHFTDCYMTPTMRTTVSPVVKMSAQLYDGLEAMPVNKKAVSIVGNDRATAPDSELIRILDDNGFTVHDIAYCKTYADYLQMAESCLNISYIPTGRLAGEILQERLGTPHLHLPVCFEYDEIAANYANLCDALGIPCPDFAADIAETEQALAEAAAEIGDTAVAVDFTAVTRPFEFAKLLCQHGFNVKFIIADSAGEDAAAFDWLKEHRPDLEIFLATNVNMLHMHAEPHEKVLGIGQKCAYYFASDYFVNIIVNGGFYGFAGIRSLCMLMRDAYRNPKDRKAVLRLKGLGCSSCL